MAEGNEKLARRLRAIFLQELALHGRTLGAELLQLEKATNAASRTELVRSILRSAHGLKGAARTVGEVEIEAICHRMEDDLVAVQSGKLVIDRGRIEQLLAMVDRLHEAEVRLGAAVEAKPPAPTPPPPPKPTPVPTKAPSDTPKRAPEKEIPISEIELLSSRAAQLALTLSQVHARLRELPTQSKVSTQYDSALRDLSTQTREARVLADDVRALGLTPFTAACDGLERVVRDVAQSRGRKVQLKLHGDEVRISPSLVQLLKDPLRHLVVNAVDHGIEDEQGRATRGKPDVGTITITTRIEGTRLVVAVADDGKGIPANLFEEIFRPGFSTAPNVTHTSGRGVGLDSVKTAVESIHGTISVESEERHGTTFILNLPLNISAFRAVIFEAHGTVFALPTIAVRRMLRFRAEEIQRIEGIAYLRDGTTQARVVTMDSLLGEKDDGGTTSQAFALLERNGKHFALALPRIVEEFEITVKPLPPILRSTAWLSGGAILRSGAIALVVNSAQLLDAVAGARASFSQTTLPLVAKKRKLVVMADDSLTTRALEKNILQSCGFEVLEAENGAVAWSLIEKFGADVVVSDVQMPEMDGLELTRRIRASPRFRNLPIVLVTSLDNEADKLQGLDAGASAYVVKSAFDQAQLIETIERLI